MSHFTSFFLKFMSKLLIKLFSLLLNADFAMEVQDLISCVKLASDIILKYFIFLVSVNFN